MTENKELKDLKERLAEKQRLDKALLEQEELVESLLGEISLQMDSLEKQRISLDRESKRLLKKRASLKEEIEPIKTIIECREK